MGSDCNRPVDVQIRPEDIELHEVRDGALNGTVTKVIFEGMNCNITVRAGEIEWLVKSTWLITREMKSACGWIPSISRL